MEMFLPPPYKEFEDVHMLQIRAWNGLNAAMEALLKKYKLGYRAVEAPQRWFNPYQGEQNKTLQYFQIRLGNPLVHFAGVMDRDERMVRWLQRTEDHLDYWEMPVEATIYPQKTKEFWREQSKANELSRCAKPS
ncbi:glycosyltransferase family 34 protein [Piedraia hortae CBS 480.64]|uniref:Glycosyltransferase family 34 protein n=1 Tax=Piedraia hortae CBS 480.64 TaxID=1314780 RepID=A0A6A7BRJ0_9PEZI|nr:glycosyltransferase family 34 protein [Piedraia hortae CBS 480.64]